MYTFADNRIDGQKEMAVNKASASTGDYDFSKATKVEGEKVTLGANYSGAGGQQILMSSKSPEISVS